VRHVIKVVLLDVKSMLYFIGTLVAHRDVLRQKIQLDFPGVYVYILEMNANLGQCNMLLVSICTPLLLTQLIRPVKTAWIHRRFEHQSIYRQLSAE